MSSDGEIIIKTCLPTLKFPHHICSRLHKSSDPLSLMPIFAIKACKIDFAYSTYSWFSFYCACASFNHKLMCLHALPEMEKGDAPLFSKQKYVLPLDPANPLYHILILSKYTIYVSGKLGQGWARGEGGDIQ